MRRRWRWQVGGFYGGIAGETRPCRARVSVVCDLHCHDVFSIRVGVLLYFTKVVSCTRNDRNDGERRVAHARYEEELLPTFNFVI